MKTAEIQLFQRFFIMYCPQNMQSGAIKNWGQRIFRVGKLSLRGKPSQFKNENFRSATPLNWLRKALILALNDSAEAFVNRSSK